MAAGADDIPQCGLHHLKFAVLEGSLLLPANITYVVFLQQSPLLALSSKFLSSSCAPDLGDIATYFFSKQYFYPIPEYVFQ